MELESKPTQPDAALTNNPEQPNRTPDAVEAPTVAIEPSPGPDAGSTQAPTEIASCPIAAAAVVPHAPATVPIPNTEAVASSVAESAEQPAILTPPEPVSPIPASVPTDGPRLAVPAAPPVVRPEPSMVAPSLPNEETEPTEQIQVRPSVHPSPEAPQSVPVEGNRTEDAIKEVKRSEMAAFIMVGVLVLVAIIFLAIRHD